MNAKRLSISALLIGVALLAGCKTQPVGLSDDELLASGRLPAGSVLEDQSDSELEFTAPSAGLVYLWGEREDTIVFTLVVKAGDQVAFTSPDPNDYRDPSKLQLTLNGQVMVMRDNRPRGHRLYFQPSRQAQEAPAMPTSQPTTTPSPQ